MRVGMLVWGRALLPVRRAKLDLAVPPHTNAALLHHTFTKPLHFFTKLYATFLVHLGLHPQESK